MGLTTSTLEEQPRAAARLEPLALAPAMGRPASRWVVPALFVLFAAAMAIFSKGFLEADEVTHFLKARAIWRDWRGVLVLGPVRLNTCGNRTGENGPPLGARRSIKLLEST